MATKDRVVIALALLALGSTACSTAQEAEAPDGGLTSVHQVAATSQRAALSHLWYGVQIDYVKFDDVTTLAKGSLVKLVISGQVGEFTDGPGFVDPEPDDPLHNYLMTVTVDDVMKGDVSPGDTVHVLLTGLSIEPFKEALPEGTELGLYLVDAVGLSEKDGRGVYIPATPQGFIVGLKGQRAVALPMEHSVIPGKTVRDFLPTGR
jgi:hypothetical protein